MTPSFRWSEWGCCSPGYISDMLCWQKSRLPYKKKFGSKKHTFAPSAQLEPHRSMFSTRKRCIIGLLIWWYQKLYSLPPKIVFLVQKRPNLAQNWHFWPNITYLLTPIKIRIFGPKTAKFGPKYAFLVIFGQILAFLAHFVQCQTEKQCEQGA